MSDAAQQRIPIHRPTATPVDGVLNIRRDVRHAREAYSDTPPRLTRVIVRIRRGAIGDNAEELDNRVIDLIVAAENELLIGAFPAIHEIRAAVQNTREARGADLAKLAPAMIETELHPENPQTFLDLIVAAEEVLFRLRTAFPELTTRHSR